MGKKLIIEPVTPTEAWKIKPQGMWSLSEMCAALWFCLGAVLEKAFDKRQQDAEGKKKSNLVVTNRMPPRPPGDNGGRNAFPKRT